MKRLSSIAGSYFEVGRWLAREPVLFGGGFDQYGYCGGDPVNLIDVEGDVIGSPGPRPRGARRID